MRSPGAAALRAATMARPGRGAFTLRDIGGLVMWLRADRGVTLGTTPRASGTTPPVVTLSGTLTQSVNLRIEVTTGGTLPSVIFRWSIDGGTTWTSNVSAAAGTVALGATGISAVFPAGTYATNNVYVGTVASWGDLSGNGHSFIQATASKQPLCPAVDAGAGGRLSIPFTSGLYLAAAALVGKPCTLVAVAKSAASGAYAAIASLGNGVGGAFMYAADSGAQQWGCYQNGNARSGQSLTSHKRCVAVMRNYNDIDFRTNGSSTTVATGVSAYAASTALGAGDNTGAQTLNGAICEFAAFSRALSVVECQMIETYQHLWFGL